LVNQKFTVVGKYFLMKFIVKEGGPNLFTNCVLVASRNLAKRQEAGKVYLHFVNFFQIFERGNFEVGIPKRIVIRAIKLRTNTKTFGSVILDMGFEDWAKGSRKDWQAVRIMSGYAFGHRSAA